MKKLDNILKRNSARLLQEPYPTKVEMNNIYKAALRAPDHAWLRPTSFIEIKDKGIEKLSKIFEEFASKNVDQKNIDYIYEDEMDEDELDKIDEEIN